MWTTSGTSIEVVGVSNNEAANIVLRLQAIIDSHLLPEERLLEYHIDQTPIYTGGPQIAISVEFPHTVPDFVVRLSQSSWAAWPSISSHDDIQFIQHTSKCSVPPKNGDIISVSFEQAKIVALDRSLIQPFPPQKSTELLSALNDVANEKYTSSLMQVFGQSSLALSLSVEYLSMSKIPLPEFLDFVNTEYLARGSHWNHQSDYAPLITSINVILSHLSLKSPLSIECIALLANFGGQAVPQVLLTASHTNGENSDESLQNLIRMKLVRRRNTYLDIDPIVVLTTKVWLKMRGLLRAFEHLAYERMAESLPPIGLDISKHVASVTIAETVLKITPADVITKFNRSVILDSINNFPESLGLGSKPDLRRRAYESWSLKVEIFGRERETEISSQSNNGKLVLDLRRYERALRQGSRAISDSINDIKLANAEAARILSEEYQSLVKAQGEESLQTIEVAICLCIALLRQEDYRKATSLLKHTIDTQKQVMQTKRWEIVETLGLLGLIGLRDKNINTIQDAFEADLPRYERELGPTSPQTMELLEKYADFTFRCSQETKSQAELEKAKELKLVRHERLEQLLGPNSKDTIRALNDVAHILNVQDKYPEAEVEFRRVLALIEQNFGYDDHYAVQVRYQIGCVRLMQNDYGEASDWFALALRGFSAFYGPDDERTRLCRESYKMMLKQDDRPKVPFIPRNKDDSWSDTMSRRSSIGSSRSTWTMRTLDSIKSRFR